MAPLPSNWIQYLGVSFWVFAHGSLSNGDSPCLHVQRLVLGSVSVMIDIRWPPAWPHR